MKSKIVLSTPGKEGLMLVVGYPSGSSDPAHRHNAYGSVHVMEDSVVMQVKAGNQVTLTPGRTFYEDPDDGHVAGPNAGSTKPAKMLVFPVKGRRYGADASGVNGEKSRGPVQEIGARVGLPITRA